MKHVSILLLDEVNLAGMENARQAFLETNKYMSGQGRDPLFNVELIGLQPEIRLNDGMYTVKSDRMAEEVKRTDIIIIPPVQQDIAKALQQNAGFNRWITAQYKNGAQVVSLCLGAFILGGTGLLEGKKCVTHWRAANEFRQLFPDINLVTDKVLTHEKGIYTGGGAFSSANLLLYVIEKNAGKDAAVYCSKIFQVDSGRRSQSPFIIFKGQKNHVDEQVKSIQKLIEDDFHKRITVNHLCKTFGIGRRTLERRFKKATGNTILEYIQRVKVEAAKRELEKGRKTVNEVMFEVGYADTKAFRNVFRKYSGMSPAQYRTKYVLPEREQVRV